MIKVRYIVLLFAGAIVGVITAYLMSYLQLGGAIDLEDIVLLLTGAVLGVFTTYIMASLQFGGSSGGYRMGVVAEATHKFHDEFKKADKRNTSAIRDRYRYGLGVIIDDLEAMDKNGYRDYGQKVCPCLVENGDRWGRFNDHIRPIIDDINPYTYLRSFSDRVVPPLYQLAVLSALCRQLEVVVMHLDAAFETFDGKPPIAEWKKVPSVGDGEHVVIVGDANDPRVIDLNDELKKLHCEWTAWKQAVGANG